MSRPTLAQRLEQIDSVGLPHLVVKGSLQRPIPFTNGVRNASVEECIGTLQGVGGTVLSETVLTHLYGPMTEFLTMIKAPEEYLGSLIKASGRNTDDRDYLQSDPGKLTTVFNPNSVEHHAIYDPSQDTTHVFAMPHRKYLKFK